MTESTQKKIEKNPEVVEKATRRRFTAEYKQRIATEAEQCSRPGELGALLRREGCLSRTKVACPERRLPVPNEGCLSRTNVPNECPERMLTPRISTPRCLPSPGAPPLPNP